LGISVATARALRKQPARAPARPLSWVCVTLAERALALVLLVSLLPALVAVGLVVAVLSGNSPLVAIARAGQKGKRIWLIKFRTMWATATGENAAGRLIERIENTSVPESKMEFDPRVTSAFAAFCRRYSIDEAPQLWHVVRGQMALVGPRPLTYEELDTYYGYDAEEVLSVKPGLTGLWQVRGRNSLTYRQRLAFDLYFVRRWSLRLYLFVVAATIPAVFSGRDAG
jgi:lipopolysaccharide/colanic/teichoic acid biosynthesis glycosyltransferase